MQFLSLNTSTVFGFDEALWAECTEESEKWKYNKMKDWQLLVFTPEAKCGDEISYTIIRSANAANNASYKRRFNFTLTLRAQI